MDKERKNDNELLIEANDELTTIVFCSEICQLGYVHVSLLRMIICGDMLCWISKEHESLAVMNIKKLE